VVGISATFGGINDATPTLIPAADVDISYTMVEMHTTLELQLIVFLAFQQLARQMQSNYMNRLRFAIFWRATPSDGCAACDR
jgi:hypothetical protein